MKERKNIFTSLPELYRTLGFKEPNNPYISILRGDQLGEIEGFLGEFFVLNMFTITLKDNSSGIHFGRKNFDFDEGAMIFTSPKQSLLISKTEKLNDEKGWMLIFHPDLIKDTFLEQKIEDYKFFSYDTDEALHLSFGEQTITSNCIDLITNELNNFSDEFSRDVIVSTLDLLLNFCSRFYERQFNTRIVQNTFIANRVNDLLKKYYDNQLNIEKGVPSTEFIIEELNISTKYLNDVLKKETGHTIKEYINNFIIEKSKKLLIIENKSISEVAYDLGFNYPHYFGRLFKSKTGQTPLKFKQNH